MELAAAFAEKNDLDGFQEDAYLKEEGHVLDVEEVVEVVLEFFNGIFNLGPRSLPI